MTTTIKTISIEQLAEKINGKLWVKGEMKRIYLDEGYNTKKMSTKTYVYQREDGGFGVSCYIDCLSQPYQWIKSQQDEIILNVTERIEDAMSDTAYIMTNKDGVVIKWDGKPCELNHCEYFFSEGKAKKEIDSGAPYHSFITMNRNEFKKEVERLDEIERPEIERKAAEAKAKIADEEAAKAEAKKQETKILKESGVIPADAARVRHGRFGMGTVVKSDATTIEILFENSEFGLKKLLTKFANLEIVSND